MSRFAQVLIGSFAVAVLVAGVAVAYLNDPERALARREAHGLHIQPGDVVLQDLRCGLRCELVHDLTQSRYTQAGVVLEQDGQRVVWEAFGPVGPVPLAQWVDRGKGQKLAVYRPAAPVPLDALAAAAHAEAGKPFDPNFTWDEKSAYSGELVARIFAHAGRPLVTPHPLDAERFKRHEKGIRGLTQGQLTEKSDVVMPVDFARSPALTRVVDQLEGEE